MALSVKMDSFSGALMALRPRERTTERMLAALAKHPRVSVWDMQTLWVRVALQGLTRDGLIVSVEDAYPWLRYELTEAGRAAMKA